MKVTPVKTRILNPPQDDLFEAIEASELSLQDGDVLMVSSKVVAIHEGRCVRVDEVDKDELVKKEADAYVEQADSRWRITVKHSAFISNAGIDESNANDHFVLLPENPHESAQKLRSFLSEKFSLKNFGVIVIDSHSMPFRFGAVGVALGWSGFEPVKYFTGEPDLFGRPAKFTRINVADSLAVVGSFITGELAEQTPLAVARDIPHIEFTDRDTSQELTMPPREDIFWPLLKNLFE